MNNVVCPTAQTLVTISRSLGGQTIPAYLCSWTALDSIIRLVSRQSGVKPQFILRKNGTMKLIEVGDVKMPKINSPDKVLMLETAVNTLDAQVKHALITHRSVEFFANRTPTFGNRVVKKNNRGQQLNGIIDISRTMDARYPIWCPITMSWYRAYMTGDGKNGLKDKLALDIVFLLETLRENLLYSDGVNKQECGEHLVNCAQPLVNMLINGLTVRT